MRGEFACCYRGAVQGVAQWGLDKDQGSTEHVRMSIWQGLVRVMVQLWCCIAVLPWRVVHFLQRLRSTQIFFFFLMIFKENQNEPI